MTTQFANSTLSFVPADAGSAAARPGALRRAVQWVMQMPQRQAVINELSALSDHELADIGLSRGDVPNVFKESFLSERL